MSPFFNVLTILGLLCSQMAMAQNTAPATPLLGVWFTEGKEGAVEIYTCGSSELCGRFYWLKPHDAVDAAFDNKNPDPKLRHRPLCGLQFMGGFTPDEDGNFSNGWIYSPRHGAKFSASLHMGEQPDTLELHGYFLVPLLGESQQWTRAVNLRPCQGYPAKR